MHKYNFFFLKMPIALSLLGHGLVRIPKLAFFASNMAADMEHSVFPVAILTIMGYVIPVAELFLGILLLVGIKLRYTIYGSLTLMGILIIGSSSVENWGAIQAQLIHSIYLGLVLWWYNTYVDLSDKKVT